MQPTSLAAYRSIKQDKTVEIHESVILDALAKFPNGASFMMISGVCKLDYHQVEKRCAKLVAGNKMRKSGRKCVVSPSGRSCIVWELVQENNTQTTVPDNGQLWLF